MSTKLNAPSLRVVTLALGALVFLCSLVWVATSPVSVSI
jgi:hypothetical protein